jgi:hypothetical protein
MSPTIPRTPASPPESLGKARWFLIAVGVGLAVLGLALWIWPVDHTMAAPDTAKCTTLEDCFVKVDDAPEILLSTLVVFGVLLLVIGINDRKIIKLTGPGDTGFETQAPETGEKAKEKTEQKAADVGLTPQLVETAKALAGAEARAKALEHELAFRRPLSTVEKDAIAEEAATIGVSGGGNPDFE